MILATYWPSVLTWASKACGTGCKHTAVRKVPVTQTQSRMLKSSPYRGCLLRASQDDMAFFPPAISTPPEQLVNLGVNGQYTPGVTHTASSMALS